MLPVPALFVVGAALLLFAQAGPVTKLTASDLALSGAIVEAYPRCPPILADEIVATARYLGADPAELANLVRFETANTFSGQVRHPNSDASGVLQFMPSTARGLGTSVESIRRKPAHEQLRTWGRQYFDQVRFQAGRLRPLDSQQKLYMAVFYPVAMHWPQSRPFPEAVTRANPGIHTPADYIRLATRGRRL